MEEKKGTLIIRNVPEPVRRELKAMAAMAGKSMQGLILEIVQKFIKEGKKGGQRGE